MKKLLQFCSLSLTIVMFASLCACNPQGEPYPSDEIMTSTPTQTSEPMVSIPEETKLPTEVPVDSTEPYIIHDENFEVYNEGDQLYHYIGQDQTVTVKDIGLEIHLPEEWVGQVEVIRNACPERTEIYIANVQLMQAYAEMNHDDMHYMDCETFLTCRTNMIHNQGQEYYDNLVGDLTCTVEQAKEILKVI